MSYIDSLDLLTGGATSFSGSTNLTVTSLLSCAINDSIVNFGEMARGSWNDSDTVNTTDGVRGDYMMITNDGNTNISVTVGASTWLWTSQAFESAYWAVACEATDDGNSSCTTAWADVPASGAPTTLITKLTPIANTGGTPLDNFTIGFNVTVPLDEPVGNKNGTVTFTCSTT